jgi:preprotein translocase subunit SecG
MNKVMKTVLFWIIIALCAFLLWQTAKSGGRAQAIPEISYSDFMSRVASGQISKVTITSGVVDAFDAKAEAFESLRQPTRQPRRQ